MPDVAERIVFLPRQEQAGFNNLLMLMDVLLDPFPFGGCTSSLEAFSFGVPVVTLPTPFLRGRFTQAFYRRLGVKACIARDVEDYIQIAVRLATDRAFNKQIREKIVAGQSRLFEDEEAVRDWEDFLKSVVAPAAAKTHERPRSERRASGASAKSKQQKGKKADAKREAGRSASGTRPKRKEGKGGKGGKKKKR
jgi:hypothetical protein